MKSLEWLSVSARKMGIPTREFMAMPIGELSDLSDFYAASENSSVKLRQRIYYDGIPEVD